MATKLVNRLFTKRTVVFSAMQTDPNIFVMPVAADFDQVRNVSLEPLSHKTIELGEVCNKIGNRLKVLSGQHVKLSFEAVMRGAVSTTVLAPNLGGFLKMCSFSEAIDATAKTCLYTLADISSSTVLPSGSVVVYIDGNKHAMMGCRGKVSIEYKANDFPILKFDLTGIYVDPVYEANLDMPCFAPPMPLEINNANTTWELHGITTSLYSASINVNTNPELRDVPGQYEVEINDRTIDGSIEIAAARVSEKNWFSAVRAHTTGVFKVTHGTVAGNIVECTASNVQLLEPKYGDQNGRRSNTFNLNIMPAPATPVGQYELAFLFK